jgi:glutaredoxin 3
MKNVIIYSINHCGYCEAAKDLLRRNNLPFTETNVTGNDEAIMELMRKTSHRTFPQIFIDDQFIGGYVELKAWLNKA